MTGARQDSRLAAVVAVSVGFAVLAHFAIAEGASSALGAVLSLVPLLILAAWLVRRMRHAWLGYVALALAAAGVWLGWSDLQKHFPDLFFVEHAGGNLLLAYLFGRTLAPGREALCTRFARLIHGDLEPRVREYTRAITIAWTLFFAAMFAVSCTLYLGGLVAEWSLFANLLTPLLLVAMFLVEYAIRSWALPGHTRVGILGGIRAFSRHVASSRAQAPR